MRTLIVIPARLESTRLPRKLLLAETGRPLIRHVVERAAQSTVPSDLFVACPNGDQPEIFTALLGNEYGDCEAPDTPWWPRVLCTDDHPNGTSRAAQVAQFADQVSGRISGFYEAYCIVQADEPEIDPRLIDEVINSLEKHPEWDCATAATTLASAGDAASPNRVKVWVACDSSCRAPEWPAIAVDFTREPRTTLGPRPFAAIHIGIYAYRREALLRYAAAGPCQREQDESLEQLRALHIGLRMGVVLTDHQSHGIDTREDYDAFVERWNRAKKP